MSKVSENSTITKKPVLKTANGKLIKAVFFDLDGTLIDSVHDFHPIINELAMEQGIPNINLSATRQCVSEGASGMVKEIFASKSSNLPELIQQFLSKYTNRLNAEGYKPILFSEVKELLSYLDGLTIPWGIVTNKPRAMTEAILRKLPEMTTCAVVVCPEDVLDKKPHPEGLLLACEKINIPAEDCLYIGDHHRDIQAGLVAGMTTITALYGYISNNSDPSEWHAHYYANSVGDIRKWLDHG